MTWGRESKQQVVLHLHPLQSMSNAMLYTSSVGEMRFIESNVSNYWGKCPTAHAVHLNVVCLNWSFLLHTKDWCHNCWLIMHTGIPMDMQTYAISRGGNSMLRAWRSWLCKVEKPFSSLNSSKCPVQAVLQHTWNNMVCPFRSSIDKYFDRKSTTPIVGMD